MKGSIPNTAQKGFDTTRSRRVDLYHRTSGRFVTEDAALIRTVRQEFARNSNSMTISIAWKKLVMRKQEILDPL